MGTEKVILTNNLQTAGVEAPNEKSSWSIVWYILISFLGVFLVGGAVMLVCCKFLVRKKRKVKVDEDTIGTSSYWRLQLSSK